MGVFTSLSVCFEAIVSQSVVSRRFEVPSDGKDGSGCEGRDQPDVRESVASVFSAAHHALVKGPKPNEQLHFQSVGK